MRGGSPGQQGRMPVKSARFSPQVEGKEHATPDTPVCTPEDEQFQRPRLTFRDAVLRHMTR